ncbi:MAG: HlyD family efflux transporter periplasmic adaptor subunit [Cyanobacteria bacterium P01_A01_bin.68]
MSRLSESSTQSEQSLTKSRLWWGILLALPIAIAAGLIATAKIEQLRRVSSPLPSSAPATVSINALGRLEPLGEVIKLSAPSSGLEGVSRVERVTVKEGQRVKKGETIAVLDTLPTQQAVLEEAKAELQQSRANLASVRAASPRDLEAQRAVIARLGSQLRAERVAQQATVNRIEAQLQGEIVVRRANVARLVAELQGQISTLNATVGRVQAEQNNAQAEVERYKFLFEEGAISKQEFEQRKLNAQVSTQQLRETRAQRSQAIATIKQQLAEARANQVQTVTSLQQQLAEAQANRTKVITGLQNQINEEQAKLNRLRDVSPADVQVAQAEVNNAIAAVKRAEASLRLSFITAPIEGEILEISTMAGESIGTGSIAEIGRTNKMIVVAEVPESSINRVRLGQKATIASDNNAFRGQLQGTVTEIGRKVGKRDVLNTDPAADVDARVVSVKIALSPKDSEKVSGLTNAKVIAEIDI